MRKCEKDQAGWHVERKEIQEKAGMEISVLNG